MKNKKVYFLIILAALLGMARRGAAALPGQTDRSGACLDCHQKEGAKIQYLKHNVEDWEKSPHKALGVGCVDCHGGDPGESDPAKAHLNVKRSTDHDSPVYFQNLPRTCGQCHRAELEAFKKSEHYRLLERKGQGPTCTTCHGSMAATVLKPSEIETTCSYCHRKPYGAAAVLTIMNQSRQLIGTAEEALKKAPAGAAKLKEEIKASRDSLDQAALDWHTFDLKKVKKEAGVVFKQASQALRDVKKAPVAGAGEEP